MDNNVLVGFTLDFETGGLDCQECACTQIAIHAVRLDTFQTIDRYVRYIAPYHKQEKGAKKRKVLKTKYEEAPLMMYSDKASAVSGITMDLLEKSGLDITQVAEDLIEFITKNTMSTGRTTKPILIGQNIGFDIGFLQQLMEYAGQPNALKKLFRGHADFYGNFQPTYIDTIILSQFAMCHLPDVTSYKLEIIAERLGIELVDAHDADADVAATTNVAMTFAQRMRAGENGDTQMVSTKTEKTRQHFKI